MKCFKIMMLLLLATALFLAPQEGLALEKVDRFTIGDVLKLKSRVLGEERLLFVSLPAGYNTTMERYPVLFLLDGEAHFPIGSGMAHFLASIGRMPRMIIVAIPNTARIRDLSPAPVANFPKSGGALKFLEFFRKEVLPEIDKNYRTQPFRIIHGHSLGGLFATYTLLTAPDTFNAYINSVPWFVWNNRALLNKSQALLKKHVKLKKFYYFSVGDEDPGIKKGIDAFKTILQANAPQGFKWKYEILENENHQSMVHQSLYNGLRWLFKDWQVSDEVQRKGLKAIKDHYAGLTKSFGYIVQPPADLLNTLGYRLIDLKKLNDAIPYFEYCAQLYPNFWMAYHNLGYCYQNTGNKAKAIENYEKSLKINPRNTLATQRLKELKKN